MDAVNGTTTLCERVEVLALAGERLAAVFERAALEGDLAAAVGVALAEELALCVRRGGLAGETSVATSFTVFGCS